MTDSTPESRDVLVDRAAVRSWIEANDGVPVRSQAETGVPIGVAFDRDPDDRLEWAAFFEAFERGRLALRVDGDDVEFVDRDRVVATDDQPANAEQVRQSERRRAREHHRDEVVDPKSSHRADEAAEQENVDNHRDEEPFES